MSTKIAMSYEVSRTRERPVSTARTAGMQPKKSPRIFRRIGWISLARSPHEKRYHTRLTIPSGRASIHVKTASVLQGGRGSQLSRWPPRPGCAKCVLNRCLKRYKAVQKCDNFRTPGWCLNGRFLGEYGSAPGETRTPDPLLRRQLDYLLN